MDIYDLYDDLGNPVGERAPRNTPLPKNRNILVAHVYIQNDEGLYLIQKRSMRKEILPGMWDVTTGAVLAGEDGKQGAIREALEEVGLRLEPVQMRHLGFCVKPPALWDVWYASAKFRKENCVLQNSEVDEIRLVSKKEMLELFAEQGHRPQSYLKKLEELLPE